jgi:hypothetical protein
MLRVRRDFKVTTFYSNGNPRQAITVVADDLLIVVSNVFRVPSMMSNKWFGVNFVILGKGCITYDWSGGSIIDNRGFDEWFERVV